MQQYLCSMARWEVGGRLPEAEDESPQEGESLGVGVNFQEEKTEGNNNLKEGGTLDQRSSSPVSVCAYDMPATYQRTTSDALIPYPAGPIFLPQPSLLHAQNDPQRQLRTLGSSSAYCCVV